MGSGYDGSKIKKARIQAGVSVKEISELLISKGLRATPNTIYSWENGNSQPTPDALLYMCRRYGVTDPLGFFGYTSTPAPAEPGTGERLQELSEIFAQITEEGQEDIMKYSRYVATKPEYKKYTEAKNAKEA